MGKVAGKNLHKSVEVVSRKRRREFLRDEINIISLDVSVSLMLTTRQDHVHAPLAFTYICVCNRYDGIDKRVTDGKPDTLKNAKQVGLAGHDARDRTANYL